MKFVDRTSEVYNNMQIIKELGNGRVTMQCILCGTVRENCDKSGAVKGTYACINKECTNSVGRSRHALVDRVGEVYNNMQIIKELGKGRVNIQCISCGTVRENCNKSGVIKDKYTCTNRGCIKSTLINRTGEVYNNMQIIKELGNNRVNMQCTICGTVREGCFKNTAIKGEYACINKECIKSNKSTLINRTGEVYNNLRIIKELGNNQVKAGCLKCGTEEVYWKSYVVCGTALCKNCGISVDKTSTYNKIVGHKIKGLTVLRYEYRGRSGKPWYSCKCLHCGEELLLDYDSIFTYVCDKR